MNLFAAISELYLASWTVAVGAVCGLSCALLGCFLVLKRMSLLGDAISHGMLPGIALAVLATGRLSSVTLLAGAMIFGVLTAMLSASLNRFARVSEDAALGVVFTSLFALGVILISSFLSHRDLDINCVFNGELATIPMNSFELRGLEIPSEFPGMAFNLLITLAFIGVFWKELKITSFDPGLATSMGYNSTLVHYLFIALVAAATVTSFRAAGSVLVLGMFIIPAATAHLLTDRLTPLLLWAGGIALLTAALGYWLASPQMLACNVGGMMSVVAGGLLLVAVLFAPRYGLVARGIRQLQMTLRIAGEEILATLYRAEEAGSLSPALEPKDHSFSRWIILVAGWNLRRQAMVAQTEAGTWSLTAPGRTRGASIVRAHRLWEAFLGKNFELPLDHLHDPATRMEHFLGPEVQKELATELDQPQQDPHGRAIP